MASDAVLEELVDISAGDLRRSINTLQTASSFKHKSLSAKDIQSISGIVPEDTIRRIDKVLANTDGFGEVQTLTQELILDGFDV